MKSTRRSLLFLLATVALPLPALAAPADFAAARRFVEQRHQALFAAMKKSSHPKTDPELLRLFDQMLDYDHFVRQSLGDSWDGLSEQQRQRFSEVLRGLIRGSYQKNLKDISGYEVTYTGESEGSQGVLVATVAKDPKKKRQEPLRIDYVVAKAATGHRVRDIVTGGVSLLQNYRRQFARIMKKDGFDRLLGKMQTQLDKLEGAG
jgi:phospholipid transport system substrate-binding protein